VEMAGQDYGAAMAAALDQARQAVAHGDVPVGAVLLDRDGKVVASAHNRREQLGDPTAHAEMLVLSTAGRAAGNWHLDGHTLVVTLEPCPMCAMAAVWARIERIVYGASDPRAGGSWSLYNIPQDDRLNHRCDLVSGVAEAECGSLLEHFFSEKRN
jgi:tRNA(adenine34) deaminase